MMVKQYEEDFIFCGVFLVGWLLCYELQGCRCDKRLQCNRWRGFYDIPAVVVDLSRNKDGEGKPKTETYVITAYCPCIKCCGKTDGITASGVKAVEGVTIATDKSIPFGTKIYIDGVGERIVQDRGGAIKGNRIDLYFSDHQSALNFGRQTREVCINE